VQLSQVHAGREHRSFAADDHRPHGRVAGRRVERLAELADELSVHGVALLDAIEHDVANWSAVLGLDDGHVILHGR
jgi:hypothetical protein